MPGLPYIIGGFERLFTGLLIDICENNSYWKNGTEVVPLCSSQIVGRMYLSKSLIICLGQ